MGDSEVTRLFLLPIERQYVEHSSDAGRQYVHESLRDLTRVWVETGVPHRVELTISGYDDDPRELYEIPEVCDWARRTLKELPVLPFFLTEASVDRFVGWVCGPMSKDSITSRRFQKKYDDVRMKCVTEATMESAQFLEAAGADSKTISNFYFKLIEERAADAGSD